MARTRVAIIGLGMAVAPHAKSLADLSGRIEVAAAYSPTEARRDAFAREYGFPVTGDLNGVFADPTIDAVLLLTPPNTHLELVRRAVGAGKHILLEKPLEISLERSEALVEVAAEAGVTLGVVLQHRFPPAAEMLAALIAEGRLGQIVGASAKIRNWRPQSYYDQAGRGTKARDGGGVLLTQGIHTLDLFVSLVGQPAEVAAFAGTSALHRMETEDIASAALRWDNGAIGTVEATTAAFPGFPEVIEIAGTEGGAVLQGQTLNAWFRDGTSVDHAGGEAGGTGADPMAFSHEHHRALHADFIDAIETGREPRVSGTEALKVHDLIAAMLRSAETGMREAVRRR